MQVMHKGINELLENIEGQHVVLTFVLLCRKYRYAIFPEFQQSLPIR